uniref:Uncharacterized protein n=1 Tax=Anguilla anguilla TaxID=7936 RepID=A0A0E9VY93_ANGAN
MLCADFVIDMYLYEYPSMALFGLSVGSWLHLKVTFCPTSYALKY